MIERQVEFYSKGHKGVFNTILHLIGIPLFYFGLLIFLWCLPSEIIVSWLGNNPYSNWATIFAVIMIIIYGTESFYLTFVMGGFMLGLLMGISKIIELKFGLIPLGAASILVSLILFAVGHANDKNLRELKNDVVLILFQPAWLFKVLSNKLGISL